MSDDGRHGITLIAFIGSVFSPYYAWARRRGEADPYDHCALNVALYGDKRGHWALTERGRSELAQAPERLIIGPSQMRWVDGELIVDIDEVTFPRPAFLRGQVRLRPTIRNDHGLTLDPAGRHRWCALAPCARIEVSLEKPRLHWEGSGYFDTNAGDEPLEDGFHGWHWARTSGADGTTVLYDLEPRGAEPYATALHFDREHGLTRQPSPEIAALPKSLWRVRRRIPADTPQAARLRETFEDTPFYARSLVETRIAGQPLTTVHESLSLERFSRRWVQALLPFRMPRRAGRE
ncbi:carotenoid 1,2-hydratase [Halorhodospira neutriphila]|uniref:Carotenoid 1,2-hydratase n=1 Tax=Halorhodospira neutriphila TaxID=168379 RepID=A0ABS1EBV7_9GAMM|nr:carotenoid 1,2-hydratase [Halorhodospira neutriphila]MBK1727526.1 carotenoid 1,2-hydratase [Halorhodospira neutriphila]